MARQTLRRLQEQSGRWLMRPVAISLLFLGIAYALVSLTRRVDLDILPSSWQNQTEVLELLSGPSQCTRKTQLTELEQRWDRLSLEMGQAYLGSGARTRKFMEKLRTAQPVTIGVIGGSVTFGHGLNGGDKTWANLIFDWVVANYPHQEHNFINGAVPATGTDYFAACFDQHVPRNADLYILEAAINDKYIDELANEGTTVSAMDYTETLVRELLSMEAEPAVVMLSTWAVPHPYMNGAEKHSIVSEYYDIPRLSSRAFLYKYMMQHIGELGTHFGGQDFGHQNAHGHLYMADLIKYYFETLTCKIEGETPVMTPHFEYDASLVPAVRITQVLRDRPRPESQAYCESSNVRKADGSWGLLPSVAEGWRKHEAHDKGWWIADEPKSIITFPDIEVNGGDVMVYYFRSSAPLGNMLCWVDDDRNIAKTLRSTWNYVSVGSVGHIRSGVPAGKHSVTCEVLESDTADGSTHVRIIAIMAS